MGSFYGFSTLNPEEPNLEEIILTTWGSIKIVQDEGIASKINQDILMPYYIAGKLIRPSRT